MSDIDKDLWIVAREIIATESLCIEWGAHAERSVELCAERLMQVRQAERLLVDAEIASLKAERLLVDAEIASLKAELSLSQRECHEVRRAYLHEKSIKESLNAQITRLSAPVSDEEWEEVTDFGDGPANWIDYRSACDALIAERIEKMIQARAQERKEGNDDTERSGDQC